MEVQQVSSASISIDEDEETISGQFVAVSRVKIVHMAAHTSIIAKRIIATREHASQALYVIHNIIMFVSIYMHMYKV
jgi:hypothetical protein